MKKGNLDQHMFFLNLFFFSMRIIVGVNEEYELGFALTIGCPAVVKTCKAVVAMWEWLNNTLYQISRKIKKLNKRLRDLKALKSTPASPSTLFGKRSYSISEMAKERDREKLGARSSWQQEADSQRSQSGFGTRSNSLPTRDESRFGRSRTEDLPAPRTRLGEQVRSNPTINRRSSPFPRTPFSDDEKDD